MLCISIADSRYKKGRSCSIGFGIFDTLVGRGPEFEVVRAESFIAPCSNGCRKGFIGRQQPQRKWPIASGEDSVALGAVRHY